MKKEIKNVTILEKKVRLEHAKILKQVQDDSLIKNDGAEKTVRPENGKTLKQVQGDMCGVQDDMGWFRRGFGALAPEKNLSLYTSHLSRKSAFTLAEVLITLGIIGIVAAMTMPTLIAKIQRNILNNQFKKMYSVLTTAFQKTNFEMDFFNGCYYIQGQGSPADYSGCKDFFYNHLSKNLNVAKICDTKAYENGCAPDYDWSSFPSDGCEGGFTSDKVKNNGAIVLNDGSILYLLNNAAMIASDINGKKGPNKPGFDVYSYKIYRVGSNLILNPPIYEERSIVTQCMPNAGGVRYYDEIK